MLSKSCTRCGSFLPVSQFQVRKASPDGLTASCKGCIREYDKARYKEQPQVRARHKRYQASDAGKASLRKAKDKWQAENPIKRSANQMVCNAVRDGRLEKSDTCTSCGAGGRIHGHHDDYAQPLVVRWLCAACHSQWHKINGPGDNAG